MAIRKKSPDILKQQKNSFLNYIKHKEKYSEVIVDLFNDDGIEKIDNIDNVKRYLEEKGVSGEIINSLASDYTSYLKSQGYYGSMYKYPDELRKSIKNNDRILNKIKRDILKKYRKNEEFNHLDVESLVNDEFIVGDNLPLEDFMDKPYGYRFNEAENKYKEKKTLEYDIKNIQEKIEEKKNKLKKLYWIQTGKKKGLKKEIEEKEQEIEKKQKGIYVIETFIEKCENNMVIAEAIKRFGDREHSDFLKIMGNGGEYVDIDGCKQAIGNINKELENYLVYLPNKVVTKIKNSIIEIIEKGREESNKKVKTEIERMLREYLNYFNYGENSGLQSIKTVYSKNKIDSQLMEIANKLGIKIDEKDLYSEPIDFSFINDVFIHTTGFSVLDEILEEGGLISSNEIQKRGENNVDIKNAITQGYKKHKDVYFSRGYKINLYGNESDDNFVFIANTMRNFANSGYGVPLNTEMQSFPDAVGCTLHDPNGYSIISKSIFSDDPNDSDYSKIDLKDIYIFVSETKKEIIENNPRYKTKNANIIYIPKEFSGRMNYNIYEFIKEEIALRNEGKVNQTPIPKKIITDDGYIDSWGDKYDFKWAFCGQSQQVMDETSFNPIRNGDYKTIIKFLENDKNGYYKDSDNLENLENFLLGEKNKIDNINFSLNYPKELLILLIVCIWGEKNGVIESLSCTRDIPNQLAQFGYSTKEIGLFREIFIRESCLEFHVCNNEIYRSLAGISEICKSWNVNFYQLKDFLIEISKIVQNEKTFNLLYDKLREYGYL